MAVKTLTIKEEVYKKLVKLKRENESFSNLIERLIERKNSIRFFKGVLRDSRILDDINKEIMSERKKFRER